MPQEISVEELSQKNLEKLAQSLIEDKKEEIVLPSQENMIVPNLEKKPENILSPELATNVAAESKVEQENPLKEEKSLARLETDLKEKINKVSAEAENWENDADFQAINRQIVDKLASSYSDQEQKLAQEISKLATSVSAGDMGTYGYLLDKWESEVRHWRKVHELKI